MDALPRTPADARPDPDGPDEPDGDSLPRRLRLAFVWSAGIALVLFLFVHVWLGARAEAPEARVKRLMPGIGAELVDLPLSPTQLGWPLETGDNAHLTLAQMPKDTLVFLNFWATWCPPCRDELPSMFRLRQQMQDRRFLIMAVSYDSAWADIRDFFMKWVGTLPAQSQMLLVRDPQQGSDDDPATMGTDQGKTLRATFGTAKLPDTYVLLNGRIVARFVNARNWNDPSIIDYFKQLAPAR